jgi:hypothetical protein
MVEGQADLDEGADADQVVDHHRSFDDGSDAQDGDLGLIDDRRRHEAAEHPWIRDAEGAALHVLGRELLAASARREVVDASCHAEQVELAGVADHRDDEA